MGSRFFKDKIKKDRTSLIKYGLIGFGIFIILVLFILIIVKNAKPKPDVDLYENLTFEAGKKKPKIDDLAKVENYDKKKIKIDYGDYDPKKPGTYRIHVTAPGVGDNWMTVVVTDTTAPVLTVKDVAIPVGEHYSVEDFVDTCEENSSDECTIDFYYGDKDDLGNQIDYSAFSEEGDYVVKITASDTSQNTSDPVEANLRIGNGGTPVGTNCQYGDLTVERDDITFPITVIVGDRVNGCAINPDLWDDDATQKPVAEFYNKDFQKLEKDMQSELEARYSKGAIKITAYPEFIGIINDSYKGLVGYSIYVKVYVHPNNITIANNPAYDDYLVEAYYLNPDGSRQFETNKYNLK